MNRNIYYFFISILVLGSGCARYKNIAYIQDRYEVADSSQFEIKSTSGEDIVLKPYDNVYINVYGLEINQLESFNKESQSDNLSEISFYLKGYFINNEGYVELPVLGKVKIAGLSIVQAKDHLQNKFDEYLKGAVVDLRLLSYQITIFGEVRRPGKFLFYKREINLLDALSQAGDLGDYGDARNIIVVREIKPGISESYNFDLTKSDFLNDPNFWLKPNDVIYVKALRAKMVSINAPAITIVLSGLTTLLLLLTYINF
jgi:polysaccharide export outer membrane protein